MPQAVLVFPPQERYGQCRPLRLRSGGTCTTAWGVRSQAAAGGYCGGDAGLPTSSPRRPRPNVGMRPSRPSAGATCSPVWRTATASVEQMSGMGQEADVRGPRCFHWHGLRGDGPQLGDLAVRSRESRGASSGAARDRTDCAIVARPKWISDRSLVRRSGHLERKGGVDTRQQDIEDCGPAGVCPGGSRPQR